MLTTNSSETWRNWAWEVQWFLRGRCQKCRDFTKKLSMTVQFLETFTANFSAIIQHIGLIFTLIIRSDMLFQFLLFVCLQLVVSKLITRRNASNDVSKVSPILVSLKCYYSFTNRSKNHCVTLSNETRLFPRLHNQLYVFSCGLWGLLFSWPVLLLWLQLVFSLSFENWEPVS